jgi:uncharacterized membrane protein
VLDLATLTGITYRDIAMKARFIRDEDLWLIVILAILLAVVIVFFPTATARIVLGLPFLLFFPGYTLIAALFPRKGSLGGVERLALSFGLSIAVVPLMGLVLNFTPWGIRLYPILISLAAFVIATSGVAWYRREKLSPEERFTPVFAISFPFFKDWQFRSAIDNTLSLVLAVAIGVAIATLAYSVATPKVGERFTEFYILGPGGKAENYPTQLKVGEEGRVIVGIVNREQQRASYRVEVWIDGEKTKLWVNGEERDDIAVELENEEEWEQEIGFVPQKAAEKQKVEFVLYKDGEVYFEDPPHLWVDVGES